MGRKTLPMKEKRPKMGIFLPKSLPTWQTKKTTIFRKR
ncbi:hypothetical protein EVA_05252 [gut metagenome]|uniref:Uncharacterized protein n=1 Tax=gut metagenome TaxID=749906 RepID=J9GHT2_9ZZZZ